ncbi:MAG: hypothetical protein ACKVWV_02550 [Planctomycetota bacterium]
MRTAVAFVALLLSTACASVAPTAPAAPVMRLDTVAARVGPTAAETFAALKSLAGAWEGVASNGRTSRVAYRMTAGDSVLVETWTQSRGREALTLYHLDEDGLIATHYCPKGNQVRLRWTGGGPTERCAFEFESGTNLRNVEQSHQHAFWLTVASTDSFARGETYVANAARADEIAATPPGETITYRRAPPVPAAG